MDVKVIREQDGWRLVLHRYRLSLEQRSPSDAIYPGWMSDAVYPGWIVRGSMILHDETAEAIERLLDDTARVPGDPS